MRCPVCDAEDTRVIDSRANKEGREIRRRRLCEACAHRFTTYERADGVFPMVVKKDGRREAWNRDKLLRGLHKACEKRAIPVNAVERVADDVGRAACRTGENEIPSERIGELIMNELRRLDEVAYVRFASVYRSFKDIDAFMSELSEIIEQRNTERPPTDEEGD
jgi:transcriptional repressor NrdR